MNEEAAFRRLSATIDAQRERIEKVGAGPAVARERASLALEVIRASCALAGINLDPDELGALVDRGLALGGRPFREYAVVAGYAAASRLIQGAEPARGRQLIRPGEIVDLHALATHHDERGRPGSWRVTTAVALRSGIVPPPFWLVPREIAAFARRFGVRPESDGAPMLFVAKAYAAFTRIHPFTSGNGRVARLLANLMLRRLGLPPLIVRQPDVARYRTALFRADSGDVWPLAVLIARSALASFSRLEAAAEPAELRPLSAFARGAARDALYKAIQRDRLRAVTRGRALFTTGRWIEEYRRSTGPAGAR
jgi:Fic family protein